MPKIYGKIVRESSLKAKKKLTNEKKNKKKNRK